MTMEFLTTSEPQREKTEERDDGSLNCTLKNPIDGDHYDDIILMGEPGNIDSFLQQVSVRNCDVYAM